MPAPGGWYDCRVAMAGPADVAGEKVVYIRLRYLRGELDFGERWFKAPEHMAREMLATALAALTSGFEVATNLSSTDEMSDIFRLYLRRA